MVSLFSSPSHSNLTVFAFETRGRMFSHSETYLGIGDRMVRPRSARHSVLWLACAIAAAGGIATRLHLHAAAPDLAGGTFELVARHSGKCLDVSGASLTTSRRRSSGTVTAARISGGRSSRPRDGYYSIIARHSGKALDVSGASIDDGAPIIQYTPTAARTSSGACEARRDGYYR